MSLEMRVAKSKEMKAAKEEAYRLSQALVFDNDLGNTDWNVVRALLRKREQVRRRKYDIDLKKLEISGSYYAELTEPDNSREDTIFYFLHGGAFVLGIMPSARAYAEMLAESSGCRVYTADYSLSPENKYPVALNECHEIYKYIMKQHPDSRIVIVGESVGGNLALALTHRLKQRGERIPSGVVLFSPMIDLSGKLDRNIDVAENNDSIILPGTETGYIKAYAGKADLTNSEISPCCGDMTGFPPTFIVCDINETLYADSEALNGMLESAGVRVNTVSYEGTYHAFAVLGKKTPETAELLNEYLKFHGVI